MNKMKKLFTWLDAEFIILCKKAGGVWPHGVTAISIYPDEIKIQIQNQDVQKIASESLREWFGGKYSEQEGKLYLESPFNGDKRFLTVLFETDTDGESFSSDTLKPSFASFSIYPEKPDLKGPDFDKIGDFPSVWAFYSFKGGVGRTIHLISLVKALSEQNPPKTVLVVDADLEAPGLTWWAKEQMGTSEICLLDFLALVHYDESEDYGVAMSVTEDRLRQQMLTFKTSRTEAEHFFLPAFRESEQLLRMPILPEHLTWEMGKEWLLAELLWSLGKRLNADAVIVDLRAGLSELSSPLLFDPRVNRVIVSTASSQSLEGTKLILEQSRKISPALKHRDYESHAPMIVLSMIKEDFQDSEEIKEAEEQLTELIISDSNETDFLPNKEIVLKTLFDENLLYTKNLETTLDKLDTAALHRIMVKVADERFLKKAEDNSILKKDSDSPSNKELLEVLRQTAEKYQFAERGEGTKFLTIQPLKKIAHKFQHTLPVAVVMGAKGSGKTFTYLQLARREVWGDFLKMFGIAGDSDIFLYPLIASRNLQAEVKRDIIQKCQKAAMQPVSAGFKPLTETEIKERIDRELEKEVKNDSLWKKFWLKIIADSLVCQESENLMEAIQTKLSEQNKKIIFLIDGLEDYFQNVDKSEEQQSAIRSLCQDIPIALQELTENRAGVLIFVRKDIIHSATRQNFLQFESLYKSFELKWDRHEAMRLIIWLLNTIPQCQEHFKINFSIEKASKEDIESALEPLWGLKLGKPDSREAKTVNWVIAALSVNDQLQARDIVRFIRFSSEKALTIQEYPGRLMPPAAVKNALDPCSTEKIEEIKTEIPVLKDIFEKIRNIPDNVRQIPFDKETLRLGSDEIDVLTRLGIITPHKDKYSMPEIIRRGLKFKRAGRARFKVLTS